MGNKLSSVKCKYKYKPIKLVDLINLYNNPKSRKDVRLCSFLEIRPDYTNYHAEKYIRNRKTHRCIFNIGKKLRENTMKLKYHLKSENYNSECILLFKTHDANYLHEKINKRKW